VTAPVADGESAPFWSGLREHRIVLQACDQCARVRFPPMPGCPYCGAVGRREVDVDGRGRLYSWVGVHRALTPDMAGEVPYNVGVVAMDVGARVIARLDGSPAIGGVAMPVFADHDDWTELRYRVES
jgi:uncharacterized OB-fold protein